MAMPPTQEELDTCMCNISPGSPNLAVLGFKSSFHGRLFGSLSVTRSKNVHKLDIPAFDWPSAEPPRYKYPLAHHEEYNRKEDERSLAEVRQLVHQWKAEKGMEVAAVIIEPILSEGGDVQVSCTFA
jgi:4-aminobutyrate aminotransferase / (S)-3-amino-2-methylpropionate transaminase